MTLYNRTFLSYKANSVHNPLMNHSIGKIYNTQLENGETEMTKFIEKSVLHLYSFGLAFLHVIFTSLSPKSDQHQIRIKDMITQGEFS